MSDDLERTIRESLDRHARSIAPRPDGHLDAVWSRVDRRRDRRRRVAAVGSALVVGAGVTGLVVVGAPGDGRAPGEGAPITTLAGVAWRCTGLFGDDGTYRYYTDCTPVAELPPFTSTVSVPATGPATAPPTTAIDGASPVSVDTTAPFIITNPPPATSAPTVSVPPTTLAPSDTIPEGETTGADMTVPTTTIVVTATGIEYEVQEGDSLFAIAEAYGVGPMEIAFFNDWDDGADHVLIPGEIIVIPHRPAVTAPPSTPSSSYVAVPTSAVCEGSTGTVPCPTMLVVGPASTVAPPVAAPVNSFRCTGVLGTDGSFEYLAACDTIGPDGALEPGPVVAAPTVVPSTVPGTFPLPSTVPPTAPPVAIDTVLPSVPGVPTTAAVVPIVAVSEDVRFYPACGNETLEIHGVTWYPIVHVGYEPFDDSMQAYLDDVNSRGREPSPVVGVRGFARVAPPGPGDDVGTLVVWADGVARWVSQSGELDVVMVDEPITYNWVC